MFFSVSVSISVLCFFLLTSLPSSYGFVIPLHNSPHYSGLGTSRISKEAISTRAGSTFSSKLHILHVNVDDNTDEKEMMSRSFASSFPLSNVYNNSSLLRVTTTTLAAFALVVFSSFFSVPLLETTSGRPQMVPPAANAAIDVSNLLTEEQIEKRKESSNQLKDSLDSMTLYNDLVEQKDYEGLKRAFRVPPISEIRRDARNVMKGLKGTDLKTSESAYQKLIEALEQVDLVATHGVQNKISQKEEAKLDSMYKDMTKKLALFVGTINP